MSTSKIPGDIMLSAGFHKFQLVCARKRIYKTPRPMFSYQQVENVPRESSIGYWVLNIEH